MRWDRQGFRNQTYDAPDFDPATYLVAVEQATGCYAGLVRVWNRPSGPGSACSLWEVATVVAAWPYGCWRRYSPSCSNGVRPT